MKYLAACLFLCFQFSLIAQGPPPGSGSESTNGNAADFVIFEEEPDTAKIWVYYLKDQNNPTRLADTSLGKVFYQYDATRKTENFVGHGGNLGSAARNLWYSPSFRMGFDLGYHHFDRYFSRAEDLPFYRLTNAYSQAAHSGLMSKFNTTFDAKVARNFAKGIQISMDFHRINNRGIYQRQASFHTAFNVGFSYASPNQKYKIFGAYASNVASLQDNGGITSDSIFSIGGQFNSTLTLPVKLLTAASRQDIKELYLQQYYDLIKKDSLQERRSFLLGHKFQLKREYVRFAETLPDTNSATSYYKDFLYNLRGLRRYTQDLSVENTFSVVTSKSRSSANANNDWLELGVQHQFHQLDFEFKDSSIQTLFIFGKWYSRLNSNLTFDSYAHLGASNGYFGDYRVEGKLTVDLGKIGQIKGKFVNQLAAPTLMQQKMYITNKQAWQNNFSKSLVTTMGGVLEVGKTGFAVEGNYHLLNNYVYYDTIGRPQQENAPISILQLSATLNWHLGIFHNDNQVVFQQIEGSDAIRLPKIMSNHSVYVEGRLFKKVLTTRVGFDFRFQSEFKADYYHPLVGQFIQQNRAAIPVAISMDFFFAAKVKTFRFFAKFDGFQSYFMTQRYFQTYLYPNYDQVFRTGIDWRFSK